MSEWMNERTNDWLIESIDKSNNQSRETYFQSKNNLEIIDSRLLYCSYTARGVLGLQEVGADM